MAKLPAILDVLRKGSAVADPKALKDKGGFTMALTAFLWAICAAASAFGYEIPVTKEDAANVAGVVALIAGLFVNYASSDKVGLLPEKPALGAQTDWEAIADRDFKKS